MADYTEEKAHLNSIINGAITSATVDGQSTTFDIEAARKRLREIENLEASENSTMRRRPAASSIYLGRGCD